MTPWTWGFDCLKFLSSVGPDLRYPSREEARNTSRFSSGTSPDGVTTLKSHLGNRRDRRSTWVRSSKDYGGLVYGRDPTTCR